MSEPSWPGVDPARIEAVKRYRPIEALIPAHWRADEVRAHGLRQHYYRTGGEGPPLVLLHGFGESGLAWLRTARALEGEYDCILPDARGHGRSEGVASGFSEELLAEDAAVFIAALGLGRPPVLGHSMGAGTAARVAAAHPELVSRVLLEDPPWRRRADMGSPTDSPEYLAWYRGYLAWLEALRTQPHEQRMTSALAYLPPGAAFWVEEDYVPRVKAAAQLDLALARQSLGFWSRDAEPVAEVVGRVAPPVLVMRATRQFAGAPSPFIAAEAGEQSNVTVVPFETAHFVRAEAPERYLAVVRAFLRGETMPAAG
ncbi:MAG TPA: alpha/beta hydrolase [Ktedonobacterales bacterium]